MSILTRLSRGRASASRQVLLWLPATRILPGGLANSVERPHLILIPGVVL